jgi:hypothetical protein
MKPCTMAGAQCPHEAVATVRIDGIGDRPLCGAHRDFVIAQGFGRVLDVNAYKPPWLRDKTFARDMTGRVLA